DDHRIGRDAELPSRGSACFPSMNFGVEPPDGIDPVATAPAEDPDLFRRADTATNRLFADRTTHAEHRSRQPAGGPFGEPQHAPPEPRGPHQSQPPHMIDTHRRPVEESGDHAETPTLRRMTLHDRRPD